MKYLKILIFTVYLFFNTLYANIEVSKYNTSENTNSTYNGDNKHLNLSKEEQDWINTNTVKIGLFQWAPILFSNDGKNVDGVTGDILKLIVKKSGLKIHIKVDSWNQLLNDFKNKKIDILPDVFYTKERTNIGVFSKKPYFKIKNFIYVKKENLKIHTFKDLNGKKVALPKGYATIKQIKNKFPDITIVETNSIGDSIKKVLDGEVDATFENNLIMNKIFEDELINNLKPIPQNSFKAVGLYLFSQLNQPILESILEKSLDSITANERQIILNKWISSKNKIVLNEQEKQWLNKNQSLNYVYDPQWKPFEWMNGIEEHTGIVADIIKLIEKRSGIDFISIASQTWKESVDKIKNNEADMYSGVGETQERKKILNFTNNHLLTAPYVFVSRKNENYIDGFKDAKDKKIAVINGYTIHGILNVAMPNRELITLPTVQEALEKVQNSNIDIFVVNALTAKYFINELGFTDLKIAYKTDYKLDLKIAIRKSIPIEAISIIDKAIETITEEELNNLLYKWTEVRINKQTNWLFVGQISGGMFLLLIFFVWNNHKLKTKIEEKTKDINQQKNALEVLMSSFNKNVIFSRTDLKGNITHVSEAFCKISGYKEEELLGKPHNIVRHPDMPKSVFKEIWSALQSQKNITAEVKNLRENGSFYWVESIFEPSYDTQGNHIAYSSTMVDITSKKEVEELSKSLEKKVEEQTKDLKTQLNIVQNSEKKQEKLFKEIESILANILLPVLITSKNERKILYANKYAQKQYEVSIEELIGSDIDDIYSVKGQQIHILDAIQRDGFIENYEEVFKTKTNKEFTALLSVTPITYHNEDCYIGMITDISKIKEMENQLRLIHKHTSDSIEYASLIQSAALPDNKMMQQYFQDQFVIWHPKDTVGGDIYLFNHLRDKNECLLMVIDCTGHGVPGAFVTMLVKAVETQIMSEIMNNKSIEISPAWIMQYLNKTLKRLLKQEDENSVSNAGLDGGIIYYNKQDKILKFCGAETPLFYVNTKGELTTIKGDRYSVGYKKCDANYEYKEHIIKVEDGMKFYCTTDGYLDQNGGEKGFPFGKKRFMNLIKEYYHESMADQQEIFLYEMADYQEMIKDNEPNDDVTLIGFTI